MSISVTDRLRSSLKRDATWRKFISVSKNTYRPEYTTLIAEMQKLHKTRSVRSLHTSMPTGRKLAEAALLDQSVRSRCAEISMDVLNSANYLTVAINTVKNYIMAEYDDILIDSGLTRITEKRSVVDTLFTNASARLQKLNDILDIADIVIKDIDQAGWSLARATTALEIAVKREGV